MSKRICVFGSYKKQDEKTSRSIINLGKLLAEKGFEVVSGGFGGAMEDVSRGAKSSGGKTIGVTYYKRSDSSKRPNKYIEKEIKTNNIFERIKVMMDLSDAFIVLPGGTGTLLELAACLEYINKGLMKPKPIVMLGDYWKNALERLSKEPVLNSDARFVLKANSCLELVKFAETPEEAVQKLT